MVARANARVENHTNLTLQGFRTQARASAEECLRGVEETAILPLHGEDWYNRMWTTLAARLLRTKVIGYICGAMPHLIAHMKARRRVQAALPPDMDVMAKIQHNRDARRKLQERHGRQPQAPRGAGQVGVPTRPVTEQLGNHADTVAVTIEQTVVAHAPQLTRARRTHVETVHRGTLDAPPGLQ